MADIYSYTGINKWMTKKSADGMQRMCEKRIDKKYNVRVTWWSILT